MSGKRSIWTWVGLGCVGCTALLIVVTVIGGVWLYRGAKRWERELKDPEVRTEKVLAVLGADRLPDGYHATMSMTVPFVLKMAILSDQPPRPEARSFELGERGLVYLELINPGQDAEALRNYFEGRSDDASVLRENGIHIDADEIVRRGVVQTDDADLLYVAQRGRVSTHGMEAEGITSVVLVECPEGGRMRIGIWFGPDPSQGKPPAESDLSGSPADEAELASFFGLFRLCG